MEAAPTAVAGTASTGPAPSRDHDRFVPGTLIADRYRVVGLLGRGGMGEVYRADDLKLGQAVALKFLPPDLEQDGSRLERLLGEVRLARQVTHANVCRVYDIGEFEGRHFLSMEYIDGEDLASLLRRIGRLPQERAVEVARQVCAGLAASHEQGILHRDLKPANIMLDGRGRVRITDFGLAGLAESIGPEEARAGTPDYMAPEQLAGGSVSVRSDLYSLGLVLYEIYTGQRAFTAERLRSLRRGDSSVGPSRPSTHVENLDPAVERAILHCLEADPADRPASALGVSLALPGGDPLAVAVAAGETPSPELVAQSGRSEMMRPGPAIALAAAALILFVAGARWAGSLSMFAYLPPSASPEILTDHARTLLAGAGYTEPAYSEPVDRAWGYLFDTANIEAARADSTADPWQGLRDRDNALVFWYRQSPRLFVPGTTTPRSFANGIVRLTTPARTVSGEAIVLIDQSRRLQHFEVVPKRFATLDTEPPDVDWQPFFAHADLDRERFTPVRPRYQRHFAPDRSLAWTGTRADAPGDSLRVEAASYAGRPVIFTVAPTGYLERLGADPEPVRLPWLNAAFGENLVIMLFLLAGFILAYVNLQRGRADRRGAVRLGLAFGAADLLFEVLRSHVLYSPLGLGESYQLLGTAIFYAVLASTWYLALEPFGRRIWPTMFVTTSRLLSRARPRWRDPLIGRAILMGLLAGAIVYGYVGAAVPQIARLLDGRSWWPTTPDVDVFISQRQAVAWVMAAVIRNVGGALLFTFLLVGSRALLRHRLLAVAALVVIWTAVFPGSSPLGFVLALPAVAALAVVLLRAGLVALMVAMTVSGLGPYAMFEDWGAWYAQSAVISHLLVVALAVAGVLAATSAADRFRAGA